MATSGPVVSPHVHSSPDDIRAHAEKPPGGRVRVAARVRAEARVGARVVG